MATTAESIMEAYEKWRAKKDKESMALLLKRLDPIIKSEAARYKGSDIVIQKKARNLAIKAIHGYDPRSGVKLTSWVTTQLKPLSRYSTKLSRPVQVSELAWKQYMQLVDAKQQFEYEHGRTPNEGELADILGISQKRIQKIQEMVPSFTYTGTLEEMSRGNSDDAAVGTAIGVEGLGEMDPKTKEALETVLSSVDDRDRTIIEHKIGYGDKPLLSNDEIAKKLKLTPAFISMRSKELGNLIAKQVQ